MTDFNLNHLENLESEAIFVIREAVSEFENLALLFSGGKDSVVLAHLARKSFSPTNPPFPLVHIDTGHNFPETLEFRDAYVKDNDWDLNIGLVEDSIQRGTVIDNGTSRNSFQAVTLLETIEKYKIDACFGGGRRDEEKSRAKERFFSHRDAFGQWNPREQRPELWSLFNTKKYQGEHFRVFPLSNFTELDIWMYIQKEAIQLPNLYFSHQREVVRRDGVLVPISPFLKLKDGEETMTRNVRFRTIGDMTCTGAIESESKEISEVIEEIQSSSVTERGTRADDKVSDSAMEDRKREGYF